MTDLGRTAREVMVSLLCPDLEARTFVFGVDSGNTRPQRVVMRSDESVVRRRRAKIDPVYQQQPVGGNGGC
jgi:hypothetical protein